MMGWRVFPEASRERRPGQVPRQRAPKGYIDPEIDPSKPAKAWSAERQLDRGTPIFTLSAVTSNLGLHKSQASLLESIVKDELRRAENELDFRKGLMSRLLVKRVEPALRRVLMTRALNLYRHSKTTKPSKKKFTATIGRPFQKARGGKYYKKIPKPGGGHTYVYSKEAYDRRKDAHVSGKAAQKKYLASQIKNLVGCDGCSTKDLVPLVRKFGAGAVAEALRDNGGAHIDLGKVKFIPKR